MLLKIVCVLKSGGDYDKEYVDNLFAQCCDKASAPFAFFCFTDFKNMRDAPYNIIPLEKDLPGWWSKLEVFKSNGPVIYLDLDTYINTNIDALAERVLADKNKTIYMMRAISNRDKWASGIMAWSGDWSWIFSNFKMDDKFSSDRWDQVYIAEQLSRKDIIPKAIQNYIEICSYKHDCKEGIPEGADVVCFHGQPRPRDVGGIFWKTNQAKELTMNKESYTSADIFPLKLAQNASFCVNECLDPNRMPTNKIRPYHIQLCPTNKCNLKCSFCSCSEREKGQQLAKKQIADVLNTASNLGTAAMTITGGGEPTLHPDINEIISEAYFLDIESGLVTNGISLDNVSARCLNMLKWCRISVSDDRNIKSLLKKITPLIKSAPKCDWAFSYVMTKKFDKKQMQMVIDYANMMEFSHVRLVSDLMDLDNLPSMEDVHHWFTDDELVIYQGRKDYTKGAERCLISLLKPVIAPDGYIYPCCGAQYATSDSGKFPKAMRMGRMEDLDTIYKTQDFFDGSVCSKCYYEDYNTLLELLIKDVKHEEFV